MRTGFRSLLPACLMLITGMVPLRVDADEPVAILPEACEPAVLAWLLPLRMEHPVTADWLLRDVGIDRARLQLTLVGPAERTIQVVIGHVANETAGERLGDVRLQCPPVVPQDVCLAVKQALSVEPRAPSPWLLQQTRVNGAAAVERAEPQFSNRDPTRAARWTLLGLWIALACLLLELARRRCRALSRRAWLGVLSVTLLGAAVRLWLAPRGLQHELFHARESLAFLHGSSGVANGESVPALVNAINALTLGDETTLYGVTLVAAVISIPALVWFAAQLTGQFRVGLLAGVLLAVLPNHVHFSASEEFAITGLALALLSWAAWMDWLTACGPVALGIATVAAVLAMQCRPELTLLPLMHLTLFLAVVPRRDWPAVLRRRSLWLAIGVAVLASWHVPMDVHTRGAFPGLSSTAMRQIWLRLVWLDQDLATWPMWAWLLAGLAFAFTRATARALWLAGWSALFTVVLLSLYAGFGAYAWRMQLLPAALACVGMAWLVEAAPRRAIVVATALALTAGLQLWAVREVVARPSLTELQYRFQRQHIQDLPPRAEILAVLSAPLDHLPRLGGLRAGETRVLHDATDPADLPPAGPGLVWLQSAACWVQWSGEVRAPIGLQPACQAVHDRYRMEPIAEMDLPPTDELSLVSALAPGPRGYRIGYYRLKPR